ncbi:MAG: hypothetical protein LOD91_00800 [Limnochordales bacterium]|nr:hypothetical protein [Limnochordales bacterium]
MGQDSGQDPGLPPQVEELLVRFRATVDPDRAMAILAGLDLEVVRYNALLDAYVVRAPSPWQLQRALEVLQRDGARAPNPT